MARHRKGAMGKLRSVANIGTKEILEIAEKHTGLSLRFSGRTHRHGHWMAVDMEQKKGESTTRIVAKLALDLDRDGSLITHEQIDYAMKSETELMDMVRQKLPSIPVPKVFFVGFSDTEEGRLVRAPFMLLEYPKGRVLHNCNPGVKRLTPEEREHIIQQWAKIHAQLATLSFPGIGAVFADSEDSKDSTMKPLSIFTNVAYQELAPLIRTKDYFTTIASTYKTNLEKPYAPQYPPIDVEFLRILVFFNIVSRSNLFKGQKGEKYVLNSSMLNLHNFILDTEYNIVGVINWGQLHAAPIHCNGYPKPYQLVASEETAKASVANPNHLRHDKFKLIFQGQEAYKSNLAEAEKLLEAEGKASAKVSEILDTPGSKIYTLFTHMGAHPSETKTIIFEMCRLAWGFGKAQTQEYLYDLVYQWALLAYKVDKRNTMANAQCELQAREEVRRALLAASAGTSEAASSTSSSSGGESN